MAIDETNQEFLWGTEEEERWEWDLLWRGWSTYTAFHLLVVEVLCVLVWDLAR